MDDKEAYVAIVSILLWPIMGIVIFFLWSLIFGDFEKFPESYGKYKQYSAKDPVNCHQNYQPKVT